MTPFLAADIERDEGCKLKAYEDTLGVWTIGVGHAYVAPDTVWTQAQADEQLRLDIIGAEMDLDRNIPWWRQLNDPRQDVMVNLCFNMGWHGLSGFHNALKAIEAGRYADGAEALLDSRWATQVHARATRLAEQMRTGVRA